MKSNVARIAELEAEVARLQRWIDDLQSGMYINCVYCGHRYGPNDGNHLVSMREALWEHIAICSKHPLSLALVENEKLREVASAARAVMKTLAHHGPSVVPHLLDTDDNPGERCRQALREVGMSVEMR